MSLALAAALPPRTRATPLFGRRSATIRPDMTRDANDEATLARGLRRRDPRALEAVYAAHAGAVLGFLIRALPDRATAEDVLQDVFVDAWRGADRFDPGRSSLATWLLVIARSRAIDQLRRRVPEPVDITAADAPAEPADPASAVDTLLDDWRFAQLLEGLSEEESRVLRMRFHLGLSQTEIAEATGMPVGTVKTRMNRALARLRDDMAEEEG
jgi:RNA polymerase sigma-70 factor (ECF subfamily)